MPPKNRPSRKPHKNPPQNQQHPQLHSFSNPMDIFKAWEENNPFKPFQDNSNQLEAYKEDDLLELVRSFGNNLASSALLKLPLEIFLDIISRLPIKPLALCRCVCKIWYTIVHHPRFLKMHHTKAMRKSQDVFNSSTSLMFYTSYVERNKLVNDVYLLESGSDVSLEKGAFVNPKFGGPEFGFELVGSCKGLVCVLKRGIYDPIYVCNPVIGEYVKLGGVERQRNEEYEIVSGFGFDEVAEEYKVVRMVFDTLGVESWVKEYVISRNVLGFIGATFTPVMVMRNGNLLLTINDKCLVCYEPGKKRFNKVKNSNIPPSFIAIANTGSFISLMDIVRPAASKHTLEAETWYGQMLPIGSHNPELDIQNWMRKYELGQLEAFAHPEKLNFKEELPYENPMPISDRYPVLKGLLLPDTTLLRSWTSIRN